MPGQVRSCANIRIAFGADIDCLTRRDETRTKLFRANVSGRFRGTADAPCLTLLQIKLGRFDRGGGRGKAQAHRRAAAGRGRDERLRAAIADLITRSLPVTLGDMHLIDSQ
ncbi:hypothetical protein [Bradyrhizobium zhanjiangense]|uniref:hypothetical protein n=1 Tax=Bradyrhizobium zhanjiangense TaxID=1325107 RepID=UPI0013E8EBE6|nr:hypothetical protein [Bradyrhizobium zhanjiangense]